MDRLLGDDQAAHGDEDLLEVAAIDGPDDDPLEDRPDDGRDRHRAPAMHRPQQRQVEPNGIRLRPAGQRTEHDERGVGAERNEDAVAEIDDVHQAEHQGQARGHEEDHHAHREPGDGERHPGRGTADEGQRQQRQGRHEQQRQPIARGAVGRGAAAAGQRRWFGGRCRVIDAHPG